MTWALGQHPNIQPMPETAWLASMAVGSVASYEYGSERGKYSHLSNVDYPLDPFLRRIGEGIDAVVKDVFLERCGQLYGMSQGGSNSKPAKNTRLQIRHSPDDPKRRWVDGTPLNTHYVWAFDKLFPKSQFVSHLRHPMQVVRSLVSFDNAGGTPQTIDQGLKTWMSHTESAWLAENTFGAKRVFQVDFDRISKDQTLLMHEMLEFLDEEYCEDCLLPFREKMNSSKVNEDAEPEGIKEFKLYDEAVKLYDLVSSKAPYEGEESPAVELRERFLDRCNARLLA